MKKKPVKSKKSSVFPFFVFGLFVIGLTLALFQANQPQNTQMRAQQNPPFDPNMAPRNCTNTAAELQTSPNEQAMLDAINAYRRQNNLNAIMYTPQLKKSAKWYSKDLAQRNVQMPDGTDSVGRGLEPRLFDCVVDISGEFTEQVGIGPNVTDVLAALKADPVINGNLLSPTADFMAIGQTGNYWVVDMVSPPGSRPNPTVIGPTLPPQPEPTAPPAEPTVPPVGGGGGPAIPSPACLGSCPTEPPDQGSAGGGQNDPGQADPGQNDPTPCPSNQFQSNNAAGDDIEANHRKKKSRNNDGLLKKLIELLEQLIKLLGGGNLPTSGGTGGVNIPTDPGNIPTDPGNIPTDPGSNQGGSPC